MTKINKIEEFECRKKFDAIVKFDSRTLIKKGKINLAELRFKGRTCFFYVIEKCAHERAVKLVRSYVKNMDRECKSSVAGESLPPRRLIAGELFNFAI